MDGGFLWGAGGSRVFVGGISGFRLFVGRIFGFRREDFGGWAGAGLGLGWLGWGVGWARLVEVGWAWLARLELAGLKIFTKLVYQEACSIVHLLRICSFATSFDFGLGVLGRSCAVVTKKDKQFLFITFLRV